MLDSTEEVSLLRLVEAGLGSSPIVTSSRRRKVAQTGVLKKQGSSKSIDNKDRGDDSPQVHARKHSAHQGHHGSGTGRNSHDHASEDNEDSNSNNSPVEEEEGPRSRFDSLVEAPSLSRYLDEAGSNNASSHSLHSGVHSAGATGASASPLPSNRKQSTTAAVVEPAIPSSRTARSHSMVAGHYVQGHGLSSSASANSSGKSLPGLAHPDSLLRSMISSVEVEGRLSTPTLTYISEAVRRNVAERDRFSPSKQAVVEYEPVAPAPEEFAARLHEILANRAATVLALKDSFDTKNNMNILSKLQKEQQRLRDLQNISGGITGTYVGPANAEPYSDYDIFGEDYYVTVRDSFGHEHHQQPQLPGANPNVARTFKKQRDFGPQAIKGAVVSGRAFDLAPAGGNIISNMPDNLGINMIDMSSIMSARSADSLNSSEKSLYLGEQLAGSAEPTSSRKGSTFPYARQPDQLEMSVLSGAGSSTYGGTSRAVFSDINTEFMKEGQQSDALLEAYGAVLNLPANSSIVRLPNGAIALSTINPATGALHLEASMDLSQYSQTFSALDTMVPAMDPLAPPTPVPVKQQQQQQQAVQFQSASTVMSSPGTSSVLPHSLMLSEDSRADNAELGEEQRSIWEQASEMNLLTNATLDATKDCGKQQQQPPSRGKNRSLIKASPLTSAGVMSASESRYLSMMDFLRARTASANAGSNTNPSEVFGNLDATPVKSPGSVSAAFGIMPMSPISLDPAMLGKQSPLATPAGFGALNAFNMDTVSNRLSVYDGPGRDALMHLEDEDAEADLEREMRELLKGNNFGGDHGGTHHHHQYGKSKALVSQSVGNMNVGSRQLSQSQSASNIVNRSLQMAGPGLSSATAAAGAVALKFPKIATSASATNLATDALPKAKVDNMRKHQIDSMLIKADPNASVASTDENAKKKKKKRRDHVPDPVISQFGDGLTGTMSFRPRTIPDRIPKPNSAALYLNSRKTTGTKTADANVASAREDDISVMSNLSGTLHNSSSQVAGNNDAMISSGRAKLDQSGALVISLASPSNDLNFLYGSADDFAFAVDGNEDLFQSSKKTTARKSSRDVYVDEDRDEDEVSRRSSQSSQHSIDKLPAIGKSNSRRG
jgi:hypothetical protein